MGAARHFTLAFLSTMIAPAAGLVATPAVADEVAGTRSDKLREIAHNATLTVSPGYAELVVRRTVFNGGPRHDQAMFWIDVPKGAVATGLRTLGFEDGRPRWFAGELLEAEAAAEKYRELTGIGGYYPKDPALLSWRSQSQLALQVFPCPPAAPKAIEYTFLLPTEYRDGRHHVVLPAMGSKERLAKLTVTPARHAGRLWIGNRALQPSVGVVQKRGEQLDIALAPTKAPTIGGAVAVVPVAKDRAIIRARVEAAPRLSRVPDRARVVVVLDSSRSLGQARAEAQLAAARSYLSHFRNAKVEMLRFDRKVHASYGRFVPVATARAHLSRRSVASHNAIELHNGSNVDAALKEADRRLAKLTASVPKRILVLTDAHTRRSLTDERIEASVGKSGAVLHIGIIDDGSPAVVRDDHHRWAKTARATGGLVWSGTATASSAQNKQMRRVYEEWARPVRLDKLSISPPITGWLPDTLDEGEGVADIWIEDHEIDRIEVKGELWSTPVQRALLPDAEEANRWAALVFGSEVWGQLTEPEMMVAAMRGRAVSPVTSYLAIEPGVRPSTEGLDWGEGIGLGGFGTIGHGSGGGSGSGFGSAFDHRRHLRSELAPALLKCGGTPATATVNLETTLAEVVDVAPVVLDRGDDVVARCLGEAVWALDLPSEFSMSWRRWTVRL